MTRARAAAKANEPGMKTARIVTAAARARSGSTATAGTKSTAAKRKTRSDENDDGDDEPDTSRRTAPARSQKIANAIDSSSTTETSIKTVRRTVAKRSVSETTASTSRTRGRQRIPSREETRTPTDDATRKITRSRAGTVAKPGVERQRPVTAKNVKFQGTGKENIEPESKAKTCGLRGRPVRRGAAASSTSAPADETAKSTKSSQTGLKKPLSPKKVTQIPLCRDRDSSEDEQVDDGEFVRNRPANTPANAISGPSENRESFPERNAESDTTTATELPVPPAPVAFGSPPRRPPPSPSKESLKSPAKRAGGIQLPGSPVKRVTRTLTDNNSETSSSNPALLQSPAKRPKSPIKGLTLPCAGTGVGKGSQPSLKSAMLQSPAKRAMPGVRQHAAPHMEAFCDPDQSPTMKPLVVSISPRSGQPSHRLLAEERYAEDYDNDPFVGPIETPIFTGRMSAVMPRQAEPLLYEDNSDCKPNSENEQQLFSGSLEMEGPVEDKPSENTLATSSRPLSELGYVAPAGTLANVEPSDELNLQSIASEGKFSSDGQDQMFQLRDTDLDSCYDIRSDLESEDDSSPTKPHFTARDGLEIQSSDVRQSICVLRSGSRRSTIGLTSLAEQFVAWPTASPAKQSDLEAAAHAITDANSSIFEQDKSQVPQETPVNSTYFEDELVVQTSRQQLYEQRPLTGNGSSNVVMSHTNDIVMTEEDVFLAQEVESMAIERPKLGEEASNHGSNDDTTSEASQEYGDENELPLDPALAKPGSTELPSTPSRPLQQRYFFTTTKVPLKPADNSVPSQVKRRSLGIPSTSSSSNKAGGLPRSATVISYSPTKEQKRNSNALTEATPTLSTPARADLWSTMGTPARTPRRDIKADLLCGAVVFVDVHTTEGADASSIFVELLSQMGAKCVKSWNWNPSSPTTSDRSANRVGITHVVFKDGGKRTMEKVRETNGVVQCVGVSWVLE